MRFVLAPFGSRGEFQPLLTLAIALRRVGHEALMLVPPPFVAEAAAFDIKATPSTLDLQAIVSENELEMSPLKAAYEASRIIRQHAVPLVKEMVPLLKGADLVIGAGPHVAAPTAADIARVPYAYMGLTPQNHRSRFHTPMMMPWVNAPQWVNRSSWAFYTFSLRALVGGPVNDYRRACGLSPINDWYAHLFGRGLLASDPELTPLPSDITLLAPPSGALRMEDLRPLDPALSRFLESGPAPIYIGFGSMFDPQAAQTTTLLVDACRRAKVRLILSSGWAALGAGVRSDDVYVSGPTSHHLLFPRVAAVVHHGGAGTTSAAAKAGRPQLLIPHAFDQFMWGRFVSEAGLGPTPIRRPQLTVDRLAAGIQDLLDPKFGKRATEVASQVAQRDSTKIMIQALERIVNDARSNPVPLAAS